VRSHAHTARALANSRCRVRDSKKKQKKKQAEARKKAELELVARAAAPKMRESSSSNPVNQVPEKRAIKKKKKKAKAAGGGGASKEGRLEPGAEESDPLLVQVEMRRVRIEKKRLEAELKRLENRLRSVQRDGAKKGARKKKGAAARRDPFRGEERSTLLLPRGGDEVALRAQGDALALPGLDVPPPPPLPPHRRRASASLRRLKRDSEQQADRAIDQRLRRERRRSKRENTLRFLLLGSSNVGKSTICLQMRLSAARAAGGAGMRRENRMGFLLAIRACALRYALAVLERTPGAAAEAKAAARLQRAYSPRPAQRCAAALDSKAALDAMRTLIAEGRLPPNAAHFVAHARRVLAPGYIPTEDDALRARTATTAAFEHVIEWEGKRVVLTDVGGQRGTRRKCVLMQPNVAARCLTPPRSESGT